MAKYPYKQYAKLMAERFGLRIERNRRQCAMTIWSKDGIIIYSGFNRRPPEEAWEELWREARIAIENHTGVSMFQAFRYKFREDAERFAGHMIYKERQWDASKSPFANMIEQ